MSGPEFFQTPMGKKYYQATMPRIAEALEKIGVALEVTNKVRTDSDKVETEVKAIFNPETPKQMSSRVYAAYRAKKPFERVMDGKDDLDTNITGILLLFKETLIQRGNWVDIITLRDAEKEIKELINRFKDK